MKQAVNSTSAPANRQFVVPLQFIDQRELQNSAGSSNLRRTVRSSARRFVGAKRRHLRDVLAAKNPRTLLAKKVKETVPIVRNLSQTRTQPPKSGAASLPIIGWNSWGLDPFDVFGQLGNSRVSFLLSHYHSILSTVWVSSKQLIFFQTSRWELLHATVLFAASHLRDLTRSHEYDRDILHHKGEMMRLINSSLDDPTQQTSDQMIAALSSLILYEESYEADYTASIHRKGLQQILQLRYAKPDLGIHRFVQNLLAYPQASSVSSNERMIEIAHERGTDIIRNCLSRRMGDLSLGQAVAQLFLWLNSSARQVESCAYTPKDDYQVRQDIAEFLSLCPHYPKSKLPFGFRSWLLTAMVYLHAAIIPPSDIYPLPRDELEIITQLKSAINNAGVHQLRSDNTSALSPRLWILMLNGLYSRSNDAVLLGSPEKMDPRTISALHWCRAQLLLRDIPWAERRYKLEIEDDWEHIQVNGFWRDTVQRWIKEENSKVHSVRTVCKQTLYEYSP